MKPKFLVVCFCCLSCGCKNPCPSTRAASDSGGTNESRTSTADTRHRPLSDDAPVLFIAHSSGSSRGAFNGLEMAVWADGFVLFAPDPKKVGRELQKGQIRPEQVERILELISSAGFFNLDAACYTVPSGKSVTIAARHREKRNLHIWDEVLDPGWGANIRPTPEYDAFKAMWTQVRNTIRNGCCPKDYEPAHDETTHDHILRGYNFDEPWNSKWLNADSWRP